MRYLQEIVQEHYDSFAIWPRAPEFENDATKNNLVYSEEPPVQERDQPGAQNGNPYFSPFCYVPVRTNKSRRRCSLDRGQDAFGNNKNASVQRV